MKQLLTSFLLVLLLAFLCVDCHATNNQATTDAAQPSFTGSYSGIIVSGGVEYPAITTLSRNATGALTGTYEFMEQGTRITGTLYDVRFTGPLRLVCRWRDTYGTGDLEITFNEELTEFSGHWNADNLSEKFPWNGAK